MTRNNLSFLFFFYLKYFIIAMVFGEISQLVWTTYWAVDANFIPNELAHDLFKIGSIFTLYLLTLYIYFEDTLEPIFKLARHKRFDIITVGLVGLWFSASIGLIGRDYYAMVAKCLAMEHISTLFVYLVVFLFFASLMSIIRNGSVGSNGNDGLFLSDEPISCPEQDLLGLYQQAKSFADKIYDSGSYRSIVFGLDAPWGIGKTSFLNLMKYRWNKNQENEENITKAIVFSFEPLRFSQSEHLNDRFVEEIIHAISSKFPAPELNTILGGYAKYLRGISGVTIFGVQLGIGELGLKDGYKERLEGFLKKQSLKLIVVIEDLDRVPLLEARQILYSMKSAFDLPNISFLVCYDSQNLVDAMSVYSNSKAEANCSDNCWVSASSGYDGPDNPLEFLEKFIHVKVPVFLETGHLVNFTKASILELQIKAGFGLDEDLITSIANVLEAMLGVEQEKSTAYFLAFAGKLDTKYRYEKIIRDPRKIKRLLNHLQFMDFLDVSVFDRVDETDFLNLLLLYISYPNVFRQVYQVEMGSESGFFTDRKADGEHSTTEKNKAFDKFKTQITSPAAFLLDQIFNRKASEYPYDEDDVRMISAKYSANLKIYLGIITKQRELPSEASHKYQLKVAKDVHQNPLKIEEMYSGEFSTKGDETRFRLFWLNFVKKINESREGYDQDKADLVIGKVIEILPLHSAIEINKLNIGLRSQLSRRLLAILDSVGWDFLADGGRNNSIQNLQSVAHRILGVGQFKGQGILDALFNQQRGVLGLYDLMLFRLYLSPDRSSNYFNINRALRNYKDNATEAEANGSVHVVNSMRVLSQAVFALFNKYFIENELNLFAEIDNLTLDLLSGDRAEFINSSLDEAQVNAEIASEKIKLKSFISYQLGNIKISSGIGCGYFDLEGNGDGRGINEVYNNYLFDVIFNPEKSETGHMYFLDYLLMNTGSQFDYNSKKRLFKMEKYRVVLSENKLKKHIRINKADLLSELDKLVQQNRQITFDLNTELYQDYKQDFVDFFDEILSENVD